MNLQIEIEELYARETKEFGKEYSSAFERFKAALDDGSVRAAEPDASSPSGWRVNGWVKKGILLGFRIGSVIKMHPAAGERLSLVPDRSELENQFRDKHTYPLKRLPEGQNIRVVPGGSSIRDGC